LLGDGFGWRFVGYVALGEEVNHPETVNVESAGVIGFDHPHLKISETPLLDAALRFVCLLIRNYASGNSGTEKSSSAITTLAIESAAAILLRPPVKNAFHASPTVPATARLAS